MIKQHIKKLARELKKIRNSIVKKYHPKKIIVFGSFATDRVSETSDLDILIIKNTKKPFLERLKEVAFLCDYEEPVDFLVYTESEWAQMLKEHNYFAEEEILRRGKVLYEI